MKRAVRYLGLSWPSSIIRIQDIHLHGAVGTISILNAVHGIGGLGTDYSVPSNLNGSLPWISRTETFPARKVRALKKSDYDNK
jgi:hypothetical protein